MTSSSRWRKSSYAHIVISIWSWTRSSCYSWTRVLCLCLVTETLFILSVLFSWTFTWCKDITSNSHVLKILNRLVLRIFSNRQLCDWIRRCCIHLRVLSKLWCLLFVSHTVSKYWFVLIVYHVSLVFNLSIWAHWHWLFLSEKTVISAFIICFAIINRLG